MNFSQLNRWLRAQLAIATYTIRNTLTKVWIIWILSTLVSAVVAYSFVDANWVPSLPGVMPLILLSAFIALALSGTTKFIIMPHIAAHFFGIIVICLFSIYTIDSTSLEAQILSFAWRLDFWLLALTEGGASTDRLPFVVLILYLIFLVTYITVYISVRYQSVYSIIPSGFVLIANLTYLPRDSGNWMYLYLIMAGSLFSWLIFVGMHSRWNDEGAIFSKGIKRRFLAAGITYSLFVVLVGSFLPAIDGGPSVVGETWNRLRAPIGQLETNFTRVFASLPARRAMALYSFGSDLPFRGNISLNDDIVMNVDSKLPFYWRARTYDQYNSWGWSTSETISQPMDTLDPIMTPDRFSECSECIHNVTIELKSPTKTLYNSGITLRTSLPGEIVYLKRDAESTQNFIRFETDRVMQPGEKYTVQIYVPEFGFVESFGSDNNYPTNIRNLYLTLPDDFPQQISSLSKEITRETDNNYKKAILIRNFLRENFKYSQDIPAPPPGKDAIHHFVFNEKMGYSDYFGSSMAVMLRAIDIPSRLAVGYLNSEYDDRNNVYVVRESGAHAWPEAYFSNYGWVPFEPTPGRPVGIIGSPFYSDLENTQPINRMSLADLSGFAFEDEDLLSSDVSTDEFTSATDYNNVFGSIKETSVVLGLLILALIGTGFAVFLVIVWRVVFSYPQSVESAYFKLLRLGRLAGLRLRSGETPTEYTNRLSRATRRSSEQVKLIGDSYRKAAYYYDQDNVKISSDNWRILSKELLAIANRNLFKFIKI